MMDLEFEEFLKSLQPTPEEQPVYEFFKNNPRSNLHDCARGLGLKEITVLGYVLSLTEKGRLRLIVRPLRYDCDCSCLYSVA